MAKKNIKLIQNEIKAAVDKFNATHDKKLEFISSQSPKDGKEVRYVAKYKFGDKVVQLIGCNTLPCYGMTNENDLEYMDEFLETLA